MNKTLIGCLVCNHRDENMIGAFLRHWRNLYPDVELVLLSDTDNPVKDTHGLEVFPLKWAKGGSPIAKGVAESLLNVAKAKSATHVAKLDVDTVHIRREWAKFRDEVDFVGFQHHEHEEAVYGCAYIISAAMLQELFDREAFDKTVPEDVGMSRAVDAVHGSKIQIKREGNIAGLSEGYQDRFAEYCRNAVIHCGQFGHGTKGREAALRAMIEFAEFRNVPELPKISPKVNLLDYFDAAWVVNLDNRKDRLHVFQRRCERAGIAGISRYRAIEGDKSPHPAWWRAGNGAWGCLMSHLRAVQDAQMDDLGSYIIFEDDACFSDDFAERFPRVMAEIEKLNGEWDMIYFGGQHLYVETSPPWPFREGLVRCKNVNRTHGFAVNKRFFNKFAQHIIHAPDYIEANGDNHIDHQLGNLHPKIITLAVDPWVCGQAASSSNITGQETPCHWWHDKGWFK